ncbi:MAG: aminoglycoside phosphotransferase, partial [Acidimicrobiales bacterium]|nr:aminoglycoside phosphotransferase [Acidimicrobiales bacterium]
ARALASVGVPAVALVGDGQPFLTPGAVVTTWRWLRVAPDPATPAELGALARTLRERTSPPPTGLRAFDPFAAIAAALGAHDASAGELEGAAADARWLAGRATDLQAAWADVVATDPAGSAVVHGDLHRDNVLVGPSGPLLSDLELSGTGPPSYDLAPAAVAVTRYGADPADLEVLLAAAGLDPRGWSGWATCVAVYELWVTAWAVGAGRRDPELAAEAARRVATLRDGADHRWHLR